MKLFKMLRLGGKSIRSGGTTVRLFPSVKNRPERDPRPWWIVDQENLSADAVIAFGGRQRIGELLNADAKDE